MRVRVSKKARNIYTRFNGETAAIATPLSHSNTGVAILTSGDDGGEQRLEIRLQGANKEMVVK